VGKTLVMPSMLLREKFEEVRFVLLLLEFVNGCPIDGHHDVGQVG
jgi:hypothetical protein